MEQQLPPRTEIMVAESRYPAVPLDPAAYGARPQVESAPAMFTVADYWRILLKRKWIVIAVLLIVVTLTTVYTLRMIPMYDAVGRISVNRPNTEFLNFKDAGNQDDDLQVSIETQVRILQSDSLALVVIKKLGLDHAQGPAKPNGPIADAAPVDSERETTMLAGFKGNLHIINIPNTRLLEVRYSNSDPKLAATVVNTVIDSYIEQNIKSKFNSTMQAADWLSKQLADLQVKVESSQEKLVKYQREHEIVGGDDKTNIITQKLTDLNQELSQAESDRIQKQALYQYATSGDADKLAGDKDNSAGTGLLANLRAQEGDLKQQIAQASVQFGPSYPKLVEMRTRLAELDKQIVAETQKSIDRLRNTYLAAQQRENMLRVAFEKQKQEANQLNQSAIEYNLLKREADADRQLYDGLLQKLKEAGITAGLTSSNIQVVDRARVPLSPSHPDVPRNIELGFLMGLAIGVACAFTLEAIDNTISTPEQVESYAALTTLGLIPLATSMNARSGGKLPKLLGARNGNSTAGVVDLVTFSRPKSELAEAYRALRTSVLLSSAGAPPKIILVTSALPEEGKTTTTTNMAVALAQQGRRVLLIDADLRRASVHRVFRLKPRAGLSDVLTGRQPLEAAVQQHPDIPNLNILPAGPTPPQPSELLGSKIMKELLHYCAEHYDHVILDSPPTLTVTDAVLLSVEVDRVILVIRSGHTTRAALRRSRDLLSHVKANVMGVVINAVDLSSPDHYYYYYSGTKYYGGYYHEG